MADPVAKLTMERDALKLEMELREEAISSEEVTFFLCTWLLTCLEHVLQACEKLVASLEAAGRDPFSDVTEMWWMGPYAPGPSAYSSCCLLM
jgi:hypothetical protein